MRFVIVQPGDSLKAVTATLGFSPLHNPYDGTSFGDPDFTPSWEWLKDHGHTYEMVFVFSDDGAGLVLLIENRPVQNRMLRALCIAYAD